MSIAERLTAIRERIEAATRSAGRAERCVRLLAVSKGQPASAVREAYEAGQRDFGENYVQELAKKAEELRDLEGLRWHMIGHLQRNKAKLVVLHAASVDSVDSAELALELDKRFAPPADTATGSSGQRRLDCMIEVNIGSEAQKNGVLPDRVGSVIERVVACPNLTLVGLMCVPPASEDPSTSRPYFEELRRLRDEQGGSERLPELSMGMTADFEVAIAAGATLVRVGTAIFGVREKRPPIET